MDIVLVNASSCEHFCSIVPEKFQLGLFWNVYFAIFEPNAFRQFRNDKLGKPILQKKPVLIQYTDVIGVNLHNFNANVNP